MEAVILKKTIETPCRVPLHERFDYFVRATHLGSSEHLVLVCSQTSGLMSGAASRLQLHSVFFFPFSFLTSRFHP
jgi:hypothetical protein